MPRDILTRRELEITRRGLESYLDIKIDVSGVKDENEERVIIASYMDDPIGAVEVLSGLGWNRWDTRLKEYALLLQTMRQFCGKEQMAKFIRTTGYRVAKDYEKVRKELSSGQTL